MHERYLKYFWDTGSPIDIADKIKAISLLSSAYRLRRILEYASFPDLIKYPFEEVKSYMDNIPLDRLWTGEERKNFLKSLKPYIAQTSSWEEAIWSMLNDKYFDKQKAKNAET